MGTAAFVPFGMDSYVEVDASGRRNRRCALFSHRVEMKVSA